ncbi:MAG TPA: hypothetical protein QF901_13995 [Gammaproteobacteria bacterium]|jgi:hypothetical protein|nr:hypothetical protein [Gammaproteobacteria bacterium]
MRDLNAAGGADAVEAYYDAMPETLRRKNDRIDSERGLKAPPLAEAVEYLRRLFQ